MAHQRHQRVMCTTTHGDGIMNQLAKRLNLKGMNNASKNMSNLKIRFGVVTDGAGGRRYAAFGAVEETEVLSKDSQT